VTLPLVAALLDLLLTRTVKATLPGDPCFLAEGISTEFASLAVSFSIILSSPFECKDSLV
jgi:hypothetical protein